MPETDCTAADTLPKIWVQACRRRWDHPLIYQKELGIWQGLSGRFCYEQTLHTALGLQSLGFGPGDRILIIGGNDPHWYYAQFAAAALGGIFLGAYPNGLAEEIDHILDCSGAVLAITEDQEQVDKLLSLKDIRTRLKRIIFWDPRGMKRYRNPQLLPFEDLLAAGRIGAGARPGLFEKLLGCTGKKDPCGIYLSSGTTMQPKLALFDHDTLIHYAKSIDAMSPARAKDRHFSYTPLASIGDMVINGLPALMAGSVIYFPERPDTLFEDLREVAPSRVISLPRAYESQVSEIMARLQDSGRLRQLLFRLLMNIGYRRAQRIIRGQADRPLQKALYFMGDILLYRSLKNWLGLSRAKLCISSGGALSQEFFTFFHAIGLNLLNAYGTSETGTVSAHTADERDPETVGRILPGFKVKISSEGEILVKGPIGFLGYVNGAAPLEKGLDPEGYFYTGDAGYLDDAGRLVCLDRLRDLMRLADGTPFSPQHIENRLKFSPYIRDAVVLGQGEAHTAALISGDFHHIRSWAEAKLIPYTTFEDLVQKPAVQHLIRDEIARVNQRLPQATAVHKMALLPKALDADDGELTRTHKIRRAFIGRRYANLVQALFREEASATTDIEIRYPNGRIGKHRTEIPIWTVGDSQNSAPGPHGDALVTEGAA